MFSTVAYFLLAYATVGTVWHLTRRRLAGRGGLRWAVWFSLAALPLLPYALVAAQTVFFGGMLRPAARQALLDTGMSDGDIRGMRVLSVTPWQAEVYVVEPCEGGMCCGKEEPNVGRSAVTVTLVRGHGGWRLGDWDAVWSDCGSADGNTFPPYPDGASL